MKLFFFLQILNVWVQPAQNQTPIDAFNYPLVQRTTALVTEEYIQEEHVLRLVSDKMDADIIVKPFFIGYRRPNTDVSLAVLQIKEEEVFLPTSKKSVILNKNSEALFVLQNIRDEAHRFAITENKRLRVRELDLIDVLSIKGVSQSSIENLFNTHKTLNKISKLSINKLSEIVSEQEAEKIYNYFNN